MSYNQSPSLSPGPGDRARYWLRGEWDQPDAVVAKLADASRTTVLRARKQLEDLGTIPVRDPGLSDDAWTPEPPRDMSYEDSQRGLTPAQRARLELEADPQASNSRIAERARCARDTVLQARRYLEDTGLIVMILATDRERRERLEKTRQQWWNELTPQPASMARGLCVTNPDPDLWQPGKHEPARQRQAIAICSTPCPALADCREWSIQLPTTEKYAVYGGMSANERARKRRERARAADPGT